MNKLVYLSLAILKISEIVMYDIWYDQVKAKYEEKAKLCFIDTSSLIVYIEIEDINIGSTKDNESRFDTSNYELERPLPKGKNKK